MMSGCQNNSVPTQTEQITPPPTQPDGNIDRSVPFDIKADVKDYLQMDSDFILTIDNLYTSAKQAYDTLDPNIIAESIYDSVTGTGTKVNDRLETLIENANDKELKVRYVGTSVEFIMKQKPILEAGLDEATGEICNELASCSMLVAVDDFLSYFYEDYERIWTPTEVSVQEILEAYDDNALSADKKYTRTLLVVNGYIKEIAKDIFGTYYVALSGGPDYRDDIRCYFDTRFTDTVSNLSSGEYTSFILVIDGTDGLNINATLWSDSTEILNDILDSTKDTLTNSKNAEENQNKYLHGYDSSLVYKQLAEIEQCTDPEGLQTTLEAIYGEEIDYVKIDGAENYVFTVRALYDISKIKESIEGDVYVFLKPYQETPAFIMNDTGSYIVSEYEINNSDGYSHEHLITAWSVTDLYLCNHMYIECGGDIEERETYSKAAKELGCYIEFESLTETFVNEDVPNNRENNI